jgi:glycosidase
MSYANFKNILCFALLITLFITGCSEQEKTSLTGKQALVEHPEWTKSANIYEVNIRQYSPEGTFNAFKKDLPRLKKMGVDILWLMPIHPIGVKNRKGKLGSYYSIQDYKGVNPSFGTLDDFKSLVKSVHEKDMKLIMDWVPNHTAWDHPWVSEHPEFYAKDSTGAITYEADWTDIALLNYDNKELWPKMIDAMSYWVEETDIDGFRVDHAAHEIPMAFWEKAIPQIDKQKKELFWLAEWNEPELHPYYDASYPWDYFHLTTDIAAGKKSPAALTAYMAKEDSLFPEHAYRMYFTSNHDENSWNGTDQELFGKDFENFAVLAATIDGMPLVYNGQESGLDERLEFFKKDTLNWKNYKYQDFYAALFDLKDRNEALWNGQYGGEFEHLPTTSDSVYAYRRVKGEKEVLVILNFSDASQDIGFTNFEGSAEYKNVFPPHERIQISNKGLKLAAHRYLVLEK